MEASEVQRLAALGFTRGPGESDDELALRARRWEVAARIGYGTTAWWERRARAVSWWIRHVAVSAGQPGAYEVRVRARGPLGLPLGRRLSERLARELWEDKPINVRLVVR